MKLDFREFDKQYNEDIQRRKKEKHVRRQKRQEISAFKANLIYAVLFLLIFAVVGKTIAGYVELNSYKFENEKIAHSIEALKVEIGDLELQLEEKTKKSAIEAIAIEQIGLVYPGQNQKKQIAASKKYSLNNDAQDVIVKTENSQTVKNQ